MPGHKRKGERFSFENPYSFDITEIDGFDNLHHPEGILKESMEQAAAVYGSEKSYFLVNGSSCGLLAAISACVPAGGKILVARNCHKSVYHGLILRGLVPVYLCPDGVPQWGMSGPVSPELVEELLLKNPDSKAVLLTSPTYEGICSDVEAVCRIVHRYGIPVIIDAAHGAHFQFGRGSFPESALSMGADLVIESLHKTLPSLTQTAVLHKKSKFVDEKRLEWYLQVYQSSSPSYVFLASIDSCISYMAGEEGQRAMAVYEEALGGLRNKIKGLSHIRLFSDREAGAFCLDPSKLVIRADGLAGPELYGRLRTQYRIQPEMCTETYVILMTSVADEEEDFQSLFGALADLDRFCEELRLSGEDRALFAVSLPEPQVVLTPAAAMESSLCSLDIAECEGRISGEFAYIYPPGIPVLAPGERITGEVLSVLFAYRNHGLSILGPESPDGDRLLTVEEEHLSDN